jgi:8-oxo-dGTP diphosphatase
LIHTVAALLISSSREVLFGLRAPWKAAWPSHWDCIGGHVEPDEGLPAALIREVREEVAATPTQFRLLESIQERQPSRYGDALHHIFVVWSWHGQVVRSNEEHSELKWISADKVTTLKPIVDCDYPRLALQSVELVRNVLHQKL